MNKKSGFTLVEIMIVVLIIGLLAAIAIPSFVRARERTRTNTCINNLRQIDSAKEQFAMENNLNAGDALGAAEGFDQAGAEADALGAIRGGLPTCPSGGTYTIGVVGVNPICDQAGHVLPLDAEHVPAGG